MEIVFRRFSAETVLYNEIVCSKVIYIVLENLCRDAHDVRPQVMMLGGLCRLDLVRPTSACFREPHAASFASAFILCHRPMGGARGCRNRIGSCRGGSGRGGGCSRPAT